LWKKNIVETSATGIYQSIKDHLFNLESRLSKYFPEAVSDKYEWITDSFHVDSSQNYNFSLEEEENYIGIISHSSSEVHFSLKPWIEFWVRIGGELPHLRRKALNIHLPLATPCMCKTGFSVVPTTRTKYRSVINLKTTSE
jgi:hypothetical protein